MNRTLKSLLATLLLAGVTGIALAANDAVKADDHEGLKHELGQRFPGIRIQKVAPAPWPGLFEVLTSEEIVYTNANADWLMLGQLLDARTKVNMTAKSWDDHQRIDYQALPFERAIRIVKGDGSRQLAVFEDPMCPFCQELENTLREMDNYTLHVFLFPLEGIHPGATLAAQLLWCSEDRSAAWIAWMHDKKEPGKTPCTDTNVQELVTLGGRLNVQSTPTIFLPDGSRISGAIDRKPLEERLAVQMKPVAASAK